MQVRKSGLKMDALDAPLDEQKSGQETGTPACPLQETKPELDTGPLVSPPESEDKITRPGQITTKITKQDPVTKATQYRERFKVRAQIRPFESEKIPPCLKPTSYNNDLELGTFTPSKFTWAGEQRKGLDCHITDSTDIEDHTRKAMDLEFFLAKPVPLPDEIRESLEFIKGAETADISEFWTNQLMMVRKIVDDAKLTQQQWEDLIPNKEHRRPPSLRTVALLHLMKNFDLGGDRWIQQFVFGFPIIGDLE